MANEHGYSIIPPSAVFQEKWPSSGCITQGYRGALSVAGWTSGNEGYPQQTFLGASIRSFNVSAGFGDTSSTMGIELVNDEFNTSDFTPYGEGDDVYHSGQGDKFIPPVVGSPVFFKFGKNYATTEQAYRKDFDQIYKTDTLEMPDKPFPIVATTLPIKSQPNGYYLLEKNLANQTAWWVNKSALLNPETKWRGFAHFTFGGILQSYTENRSSAGNPLYSVKLVDPREILTNTQLVLNNYQGTTFNNKNLYNIYGFLEYDLSHKLVEQLESKHTQKSVLEKIVSPLGEVSYKGRDEYIFDSPVQIEHFSGDEEKAADMSGIFPITGQGFARRSDNGMPWYRIEQAMKALFSYDTELPAEYNDAGFGGVIDFRGYNYVVDWGGIPTEDIPNTYYLDFDQISMMDLAQELCDVLSRDLFVSLLPVIDHPSCKYLFKKNQEVLAKAKEFEPDNPMRDLILGSGLVAGIIRIDSIDKKDPPAYGAIKSYLDNLEKNGIYVENRDVGFELSNVTTDRFIVGAQEVDMYYFNGSRDRDNYLHMLTDSGDEDGQARYEQMQHDKWTIETNENQQILPYYGIIGDNAVTIPRGFGSYQQILLDARHLDAHGVGAYYVATEMELRAAAVSFKQWSNFLLTYNEIYIQELSNNQAFYAQLGMNLTEEVKGINDQIDPSGELKKQLDKLTAGGRNFGVSVPRCVWNSDKAAEEKKEGEEGKENTGGPFEGMMGKDGYPASPCSPPFGYPLYYKRAEKIGIPQAGLVKITGALQTVVTNIENLENMERTDKQRFSYVSNIANNSIKRLESLIAQKQESKSKATADGSSDTDRAFDKDIKILKDRIEKIKANVVKEREEIESLRESNKLKIAELKTLVKNSSGLIKNLSKYQRDSLDNAKKVYNFVKKVADENLGKKFLVKIPRATNVNYARKIKTKSDKAWDVIKGPFGFPPEPISTTPDYKGGDDWKSKKRAMKVAAKTAEREGPTANDLDGSIWPTKSNAHWHYVDVDAMGQACKDAPDDSLLVPYGSGYTYGALKCNWNPMAEKWEYNYKPEPQGGFFNYALYDKNLKAKEAEASGVKESELPAVTRAILAPKLMDKLVEQSNRIQCYVRYDHSQHLDFSSINADSVEQQTIEDDGDIIPDVMETLPNLTPDKKESLNQIQGRIQDDKDLERQGKSVAFVKCTLDEKFYMPPKIVRGDATVWAEKFDVAFAPTPYEVIYIEAEKLSDEQLAEYGDGPWEGCKVPREVKKRPVPVFSVSDGGLLTESGETEVEDKDAEGNPIPSDPEDPDSEPKKSPVTASNAHKVPWDDFEREWSDTYKGWIVKTKDADLDSKHVYALITVPGRIIPTVDKRYVDGPLKSLNGVSIANAMTEDVVKIDEFAKPGGLDAPDPIVDCADLPSGVEFTFEDLSRAVQAQKDAAKGISLSSNGDNSLLAFTSPSPVYPDVVAIPLMSMERCYGPWLSSALDGKTVGGADIKYSDIGGKIEFIKEEGLNPWSYAGYQLMDQAAKLKTKFSNSLLLFSERGSFSYPSAPIEVSLAKALQDKGPLVTSVSVDVSDNSIKTSVKLDLYTAQFGKLHKQKEIAIAQITRERQKMIDQNNSLIRRGLGKGAADTDILGTIMRRGGQALIDGAKNSSDFFTALERGESQGASMITVSATNTTEDLDGTSITSENAEGSMQSESQLQEKQSLFRDQKEFDEAMKKTAGGHIPDIFKGVSDSPHDQFFASRRQGLQQQRNRRTFE
jgi:hypothetical protein